MANDLKLAIEISADPKKALDGFVALGKKLRDTQTEFRAAQEKVKTLALEIQQSESPSKALAKQYETAQKTVSGLSAAIDGQRAALKNSRSALQEVGVDVANLSAAYKKLAADQAQAAKQTASSVKAQETAGIRNNLSNIKAQQNPVPSAFHALDMRAFAAVEAEIARVKAAYQDLANSGKISLNELAKAKLQLKDKLQALHGETNNFGGALRRLSSEWLAFGAAIASGASLLKGVVDAGVKMEAFGAQLKAATGSGEKAAESLTFIRAEADRLGLPMDTLAGGFAKLAAAAKGTVLEGKPLQDIFSGISEAATVMHLSTERVDGVIGALSQMMGKGVVSAEEFRQQLGDHLPQATQVGAKALGVTTAEFIKMLNNGEILANDFLPRFAKALRESVAGGLPEAVDSATASFNRLHNALLDMRVGLADSGILAGVSGIAEVITGMPKAFGEATIFTKAFIGGIVSVGGALATWKLALQPIVSAIQSALIPVMTGATVASGLLATAMRAIPFVGWGLAALEAGRALGTLLLKLDLFRVAGSYVAEVGVIVATGLKAMADGGISLSERWAQVKKIHAEFEQIRADQTKAIQAETAATAQATTAETQKNKVGEQAAEAMAVQTKKANELAQKYHALAEAAQNAAEQQLKAVDAQQLQAIRAINTHLADSNGVDRSGAREIATTQAIIDAENKRVAIARRSAQERLQALDASHSQQANYQHTLVVIHHAHTNQQAEFVPMYAIVGGWGSGEFLHGEVVASGTFACSIGAWNVSAQGGLPHFTGFDAAGRRFAMYWMTSLQQPDTAYLDLLEFSEDFSTLVTKPLINNVVMQRIHRTGVSERVNSEPPETTDYYHRDSSGGLSAGIPVIAHAQMEEMHITLLRSQQLTYSASLLENCTYNPVNWASSSNMSGTAKVVVTRLDFDGSQTDWEPGITLSNSSNGNTTAALAYANNPSTFNTTFTNDFCNVGVWHYSYAKQVILYMLSHKTVTGGETVEFTYGTGTINGAALSSLIFLSPAGSVTLATVPYNPSTTYDIINRTDYGIPFFPPGTDSGTMESFLSVGGVGLLDAVAHASGTRLTVCMGEVGHELAPQPYTVVIDHKDNQCRIEPGRIDYVDGAIFSSQLGVS